MPVLRAAAFWQDESGELGTSKDCPKDRKDCRWLFVTSSVAMASPESRSAWDSLGPLIKKTLERPQVPTCICKVISNENPC